MTTAGDTLNPHATKSDVPLAIIGIGAMFPGAAGTDRFWTNIRTGVDGISEIPATHWRAEDYYDQDPAAPDKVYAHMGGFLDPVDFNPMDYGILPNSIEAIDTSQLLGLLAVEQALKDAGYPTERNFDRDMVSVVLGVTGTLELVIPLGARLGYPRWKEALADAGVDDAVAQDVMQRIADSYVPWQENSFPGLLGNVVAGRISKHFNFGGTNCVVDAACGSSLSALNLAGLELAAGRSDMVVTGGIDTFNDIFMYTCFSKTPALSPSGHARPYDRESDGTTLGEGLGVVVLKRLADAERDGDRIYAVIKGIGTSSDGRGAAIYEPDAGGQAKALRRAYRQAAVDPRTIELIEGHGTGTRVGDAIELSALKEVFGVAERPWCALGSIKSQIGHTKAAAGAAGVIKAALALYHKTLPATIKVEQPQDVLCAEDSPFYVNTQSRPWIPYGDHPRRAGVSALGFGGSNFHCLLEEYQSSKNINDWSGDVQLMPFSGPDRAALEQQLTDLATDEPWEALRARAARLRRDFVPAAERLVLVTDRTTDRAAQRDRALQLLRGTTQGDFCESPDGIYYGRGEQAAPLALLFPGQGAQYPGMLRDLALQFPEFHLSLLDADRVFSESSGLSPGRLNDLIYPQPAFSREGREKAVAALQATEVAQPALGAVSIGAGRVLAHFGVDAQAVAGHSYGELTALCAAEVFTTRDLLHLSRLRGKLMAGDGGDRGSMLAVSAPLEQIEEFLGTASLDLVLANRNTPEQGVLSGSTEAIADAERLLQDAGMHCQRLTVSAAFHSPLIADAAEPFAEQLQHVGFQSPRKQLFSNTTADAYPDSGEAVRELLARQLASPVDFVGQVEQMYRAGVRTFVEAGPGSRLTGMVKRILHADDARMLALDSSNGKRSGILDLARLLAQLSALGYPLSLELWDPQTNTVPQPDKKPALTIPLCGANHFPKPAKRPPATPTKKSAVEADVPPREPCPTPKLPPATAERKPAPEDSGRVQQSLQITQQSLQMLQNLQQQTAQLHQQFLEGQQNATRSLLQLMEEQRRLFHSDAQVADMPITDSPQQPASTPEPHEETAYNLSGDRPTMPDRQPSDRAPAAPDDRIAATLLQVIAEKTGYPEDMLELEMSLDGDLGIDSIKRVEILSALQEQLPELPAVRPEELGTLQTLGQIVAHLQQDGGGERLPMAPAAASVQPSQDAVAATLLQVIAEKTGYPEDMLELEMSLDGDLGIDSIKRVEILSALQEQLPGAPAIKPEHLATLQTVAQIVDFIASVGGSDGASSAAVGSHSETAAASVRRQILKAVPLIQKRREKSLHFGPGREVWITDDDSALSDALCSALTAHGLIPRKRTIDSIVGADDCDLLAGLVILTPLKGIDDNFLRQSFLAVQHALPALSRSAHDGGAFFATISRVDGAFGFNPQQDIHDPLSGGLAGLTKTVAQEAPDVHCKALDLAMGMEIAATTESLVRELFSADPIEVGLTSRGLMGLELDTESLVDTNGDLPLKAEDLVVVTGGARGVTAEAAVALAEATQATLLLLGRTPLEETEPDWLHDKADEMSIKKALANHSETPLKPRDLEDAYRQIAGQREIRTTLERILRAGGQALYRSVDLRDEAAVAAIIDETSRRFGAVRGLLHGAGVLADKLIAEKTPEQFDRVYQTKIAGLRGLLNHLDPAQLKALVYFSSSTARFGRVGQVDYAIANEVLNKLAQQQAERYHGCRVCSINWGPWDGGMVTPELKKLFLREGVEVIDLQAGPNYLIDELRAGNDSVEVIAMGGPAEFDNHESIETHQNLYVSKAFDLDLSIADYPFLQSHVIDGKAVLPVAVMLEWLAHGALHNNPGLKFQGINDLRVLKGVILDADETRNLQVMTGKAIKSDGLHMVPVELSVLDEEQNPTAHARGRVVLANVLPEPRQAFQRPELPAYPHAVEELYQSRRLFHGQALQGIREVTGCSEQALSALVSPAPTPAQWLAQPLRNSWLADPLALDCSFQALILWSFEHYQAGSLPVFIGRYRQYQDQYPHDGVEIRIQIIEQSRHKAVADIDLVDPRQGHLVARIERYECVIDPSLNETFQRNQLAGVASR